MQTGWRWGRQIQFGHVDQGQIGGRKWSRQVDPMCGSTRVGEELMKKERIESEDQANEVESLSATY